MDGFLHSPYGTQHMAGSRPTACRFGIRCTRTYCDFAHPSKALQCVSQVCVCVHMCPKTHIVLVHTLACHMKEEPISRTSPSHPPIVATFPVQFSVPLSEWHSCFQAHYTDSESDLSDYDDEDLVDYIVDRLKESASGSLSAGPL